MTEFTFSIITPCLNRADYIIDAVESVLQQNDPRVEHIIIDGGSTDNTLALLRRYPHLRIVSEPDQGMYDAINKGGQLSSGEVVGLLNSDDLYPQDCFQHVRKTFQRIPEAPAVMGAADFLDAGGKKILRTTQPIGSGDFWERIIQGTIIPNAWFFRRSTLAKIGTFNTHYRFAADRDFLMRAALAGVHPEPIDQVLYRYRQHDKSATISSQDSRLAERGAQRMKVLSEELDIYEYYLSQHRLPCQARHSLHKAHYERSYRLCATAFYHHQYPLTLGAALRGCRRDALWPLHFVFLAARRASKEFRQNDQE